VKNNLIDGNIKCVVRKNRLKNKGSFLVFGMVIVLMVCLIRVHSFWDIFNEE
jgi:hypothetical protein